MPATPRRPRCRPFKQTRAGGTYGGPIVRNRTHMFAAYEYLTIDKAAIVSLPANNPFATQQNGNYPFNCDRAHGRRPDRPPDQLGPVRRSSAMPSTISSRRAAARRTPPAPSSTTASRTASRPNTTGCCRRTRSTPCACTIWTTTCSPSRPTSTCRMSRPSYTFGQNGVAPQYFPRKIGSLFETFYINTPRHDIKIGGEFTHASSNFEAHFTEHGAFTFLVDTPFNAADSRTWPFTFVQQIAGPLQLLVQSDCRLRAGRLARHRSPAAESRPALRPRHQPAPERPLRRPARQSALQRASSNFVSADRGNDTNNLQPRLGATYDIRGNGTLVARAASRPLRDAQPAVAAADVDGQDARRRRCASPIRSCCRYYPDINAVLGGRTLDEYVSAGGVRSLYLIADDYVLPVLVQHDGRHRLADQRGHLARRRLRAQRRHAPARDDRPEPAGQRRHHRRPIRGRCRSSARWACSSTSPRAGTTRSRCSCGPGCRGTDSLQVSYAYSKSTLDGVTFYSTYRGTDRTPREKGLNPTDTPHNLSVAASTSLPWGVQLSGVFRAISGGPLGGDRGHRPRRRPQHPERPAGRPADHGRARRRRRPARRPSTRSGPPATRRRSIRTLLEPDPIIGVDVRLTKAFSIGGTRKIEAFLEAYNATNYTTLTGGSGNMSLPTFLVRTGARDARQVQWGARYSF